jgi:FMN phosphatase YigB (HAD superfamily)
MGMPLSLEQYAASLDARNLPWPAPPHVRRPRARPHLKPLPEVRAVIWSIYGTLLTITGGELLLEHRQKLMMELALDKTLQEFRMWGSMTRKPGQPADYLAQIYGRVLGEQMMAPAPPGERHPEVLADRLWEEIIKKLLQKDYKWDVGAYGSLNEYSRKVAYFFHASLQGTACYRGAPAALRHVTDAGLLQGWLDNGQVFTPVQLARGLEARDPAARLDDLFAPDLRVLSYEYRARKPSDRLFHEMLARLETRGVDPREALYVGAHIDRDIVPARRLGMRTALFAGDVDSVSATPEQLKDRTRRPDVLLTKLPQIADVVPGRS